MLLVLKRTVSMRWSYCAPKTHVNTDGTPQVKWSFVSIFYHKHLRKKLSVLTEHQTCNVCEGGGGEARWKFYMMWSGSSEPSLVANSIRRWFTFCMCLQEVKWAIVLLLERERKMFFFLYIIFILFDTSVTFYASMFCDSGPNMHRRLCDSFFHLFLPT